MEKEPFIIEMEKFIQVNGNYLNIYSYKGKKI